MGEKIARQYNRTAFLRANPFCCYCGRPADTTDHCPPRALFYDRHWPEGYEFPCCKTCNDQGRLDDQVIAVIARTGIAEHPGEHQAEYWARQLRGLKNTQPHIIDEWLQFNGRAAQKHLFSEKFGSAGNQFFKNGYKMAYLGPMTLDSIKRFSARLGKALFYKHCKTILDGEIWFVHFDATRHLLDEDPLARLQYAMNITPNLTHTARGNISLSSQFHYRFNASLSPPVGYFLVRFSEQVIFSIAALSDQFLNASTDVPNRDVADRIRIDARLPRKAASQP